MNVSYRKRADYRSSVGNVVFEDFLLDGIDGPLCSGENLLMTQGDEAVADRFLQERSIGRSFHPRFSLACLGRLLGTALIFQTPEVTETTVDELREEGGDFVLAGTW